MERKSESKSSFFWRKPSRKSHIQEAQVEENFSGVNINSQRSKSEKVKSPLLPSKKRDNAKSATLPAGASLPEESRMSASSSHGVGLFTKLKRRFKIRSSRGKYDMTETERPRRKSDDPSARNERRDEDESCDEDKRVVSSAKTARRTHSDKEEVILIGKNKRVSVLAKSGNSESELIFSNVLNSEDDGSESFGEGEEEDPYATISSVKDEMNEKFASPEVKKKAEKLEKDKVKARELLSTSVKKNSNSSNGDVASKLVIDVDALYAKIKKRNAESENTNVDTSSSSTSGAATLDAAQFNLLSQAKLKSHLEPQYEALEDVRQRSSLLYEGYNEDNGGGGGSEDLSQSSSVPTPEVGLSSTALNEPDYETLDDVKEKIEQSFSLSSKDTTPTAHNPSTGHYTKIGGSKGSKLTGSLKSTSASSFSTNDRSPVEVSMGSKDSCNHDNQPDAVLRNGDTLEQVCFSCLTLDLRGVFFCFCF